MRQCGYAPSGETASGELIFSRAVGPSRSGYPRFHLYIRPREAEADFNLHLDQKAPIYKTRAHGGEYEGELVEREAERIKLENSKF